MLARISNLHQLHLALLTLALLSRLHLPIQVLADNQLLLLALTLGLAVNLAGHLLPVDLTLVLPSHQQEDHIRLHQVSPDRHLEVISLALLVSLTLVHPNQPLPQAQLEAAALTRAPLDNLTL